MSMPGYGYGGGASEPGARRKRFAAMAGSLYNAGKAAATEIKETYNQGRSSGFDMSEGHHTNIPGAFPDISIVVEGNEQMVLFPSYAKNHERRNVESRPGPELVAGAYRESWHEEWRAPQDENTVVDVDVRGWVYSPHQGPMTRRNRLLIGAARQLSGIPAPRPQSTEPTAPMAPDEPFPYHEARREEYKIAREAARIERIGQEENEAATRGDYSENPATFRGEDPDFWSPGGAKARNGSQTPISISDSPTMSPTRVATSGNELDDAELAVANANLMSRLGPFLTTPLARIPMTMFFYNDKQSQSRTTETNDAGHFSVRAALEFVPTHVRVIAKDRLSSIQSVNILDPTGISLISDIDDTVKKSNISMGAKEIFRNTFARDLSTLTIPGVSGWYNKLYNMGVHMHYCSNSPWQLFPVLATFFKLAGLPEGSMHLKHYPSLLQGIFEPVAERKKPTLDKILADFPSRKFILVGDSGEADLEVYTELALANPGRILAIFIRDVTTPVQPGFFDSAYNQRPLARSAAYTGQSSQGSVSGHSAPRPVLPPRPVEFGGQMLAQPIVGNLIDFSDEEQVTPLPPVQQDTRLGRDTKKGPPPRPAKPAALRSNPSEASVEPSDSQQWSGSARRPPPPPQTRKSIPPHTLPQAYNSTPQYIGGSSSSPLPPKIHSRQNTLSKATPPPPPPPRKQSTQSSTISASPRSIAHTRATSNNDVDNFDLPPSSTPLPNTMRVNLGLNGNDLTGTGEPYNKKLVMWRTRLDRAQQELHAARNAKLYIWRRGEDAMKEAEGLVKDALYGMGLWK